MYQYLSNLHTFIKLHLYQVDHRPQNSSYSILFQFQINQIKNHKILVVFNLLLI